MVFPRSRDRWWQATPFTEQGRLLAQEALRRWKEATEVVGPVVMRAGNLQLPASQATSRTAVFDAVYTALRSIRLQIECRQSDP